MCSLNFLLRVKILFAEYIIKIYSPELISIDNLTGQVEDRARKIIKLINN
jgi:hypothetical protein